MTEQQHVGPGAPVLDIGDDVGAIVVHLDTVPPGGELHACPSGASDDRFHTGVHERDLGVGRGVAAVFPAVREGRYHLLDPVGAPMTEVVVRGGEVSEVDLRAR